jgi:hypothetical protein
MTLLWRRKLPTGDALEKVAERLGVSTHEIYKGGAQKLTTLDEPELQRRILAARAERRDAILNIVQTIGIMGTLVLTIVLAVWNHHAQVAEQIAAARRASSEELVASRRESGDVMLKFDEKLYSGASGRVMRALDDQGNLDRVDMSGSILDDAIGDFLDKYELLAAAYRNGLIDEDMGDDAFSYELEKGLQDRKIRDYIAAAESQESDLYEGVLELAQAWGINFPPIAPAAKKKGKAPGAE